MRFEDFARSHGLILRDIVPHKWVSTPTEDHPKKRNGRYKFIGDVGWVQNWATMDKPAMWKSKTPVQIDYTARTRASEDRQEAANKAAAKAAWTANEVLIKRLARIETLTLTAEAPKGAITIPAEGAAFAIPLAGIIDIAEEQARLQKTLDKLTKEINGLKGRLNNPNFAASAPEEVVDEARANLEAREDEAGKLQAALRRLAELA